MQTKAYLVGFGSLLVMIQAACGSGPTFGLGPALDPIVSLIVAGALIVGAYWVVKSVTATAAARAITSSVSAAEDRLRGHTQQRTGPEVHLPLAQELVRERYARGEIDREQYLEMLEDLKKK